MKKLTTFSVILFFALSASAENKLTSEEYIVQWKITAIEQMNEHAIPASITLAQGILESGNGNSRLAQNANNHFGIKCHKAWDGKTFYQDDDEKDECFRSYDNAALSYDDHSLFLTGRERYSGLFELTLTDYKGWAKGLKKAGYATNPKYADLLITIIERHDLGQYDLMPYLPMEMEKEREQAELTTTADKDAPVTVITGEEEKEIEVIAVSKHQVALNKYRTRYVTVSQGDTFYTISKEFDISLWQLYKYNELGKRDVLKVGEIIYLDPKRGKSKKGSNVFICTEDMSLRQVAQAEGLKLKKLLKYNFSEEPDKVLPKGTKVILR
ncbi:MAG: LysM peptidoglycan-binding domain-containing protein [Crocinitomix sp.]|nr:LysM peptidoglycan-binding domain-containing protein [Crocinitomix sp.]